MECLTNPAKHKLLLETIEQGKVTTKELAQKFPDIPQATLYRYLKKMVDQNVLKIAEERPVRGVTEKIYAPNIDLEADIEQLLKDNSGKTYLLLFQQFCLGLMEQFKTYSERDSIDIMGDGSGFRVASFNATNEELTQISREVWKLILPYTENKPTPDRKARSVAVIFTPPTK